MPGLTALAAPLPCPLLLLLLLLVLKLMEVGLELVCAQERCR